MGVKDKGTLVKYSDQWDKRDLPRIGYSPVPFLATPTNTVSWTLWFLLTQTSLLLLLQDPHFPW